MTIQAYLGALEARLRMVHWQRRRILAEVRDHLEQAAAQERTRGCADAEARAVERFGDVELIAREFAAAWRRPSRGGRIAFLWLSVSAACAASLAMTWSRADIAPSLITVADAVPRATNTSYRLTPQTPRLPHVRMIARAAAVALPQEPTVVEEPPVAPSPAPTIEFARVVALVLPPPPGIRVERAPHITPPVPLPTRTAAVRYPAEARLLAVEGDVRLRLHIDTHGNVDAAAVVQSLGHGLDEVAQDVVRSLRFRPATDEAGAPVGAFVDWTVHCARAREPALMPVFGQATAPQFFGRSRI